MNRFLRTALLALLLLMSSVAKSQILITLLFGEALNTPKIEFGLIGGINRSYLLDVESSEGLNNFNLGFYFHINLKNKSYLSTGVLVKSDMGATGMKTYALGDKAFDSIYQNGTLTKKIGYFYVPIMYQYRLHTRWYVEGGFQLGLKHSAKDVFKEDILGGDLEFSRSVKDEYVYLDAGLVGGLGFKLNSNPKSAAIGVNYYYGLVNVSNTGNTLKNSAIYFYGKIPIGVASTKSIVED